MQSVRSVAALASLAILAGCAWQSKVLRIDSDSYQVSANASPIRGGITGAREMALSNANKHCAKLGKQIEVSNIETDMAFPANGVATVTFACR